ncbi:hypothetical protein [Vibrio fluvialis]|uniref:hypothetical protein n=1 Tax=Vibrio fluvialis TaxID=676 RepID=UPI00192AAEFF|nr:hypothetical protein [Vibrio fluvialis]EKO3438178.1 hypothetical protein [Vibrio fluvialis]EKO3485812.1 hypothetical protein [Vibrio fluvialis]MBL4259767.1 hypothetical protein [Vibrio fluvialis]MBL4305031.1 hypothetical protein [Vibrio fluvialis]MBY7816482.1 hypothetical protein [Vibrio fluvialis]
MRAVSFMIIAMSVLLAGCANEHALGYHVAQVRDMQTYNPNATLENMDVIPEGNGERMEDVYKAYTGKKGEDLKGSSTSQVLKGFN